MASASFEVRRASFPGDAEGDKTVVNGDSESL